MAIEYDVGLLYGRRIPTVQLLFMCEKCNTEFPPDELVNKLVDLGILHSVTHPSGKHEFYIGWKALELPDVLHTLEGTTDLGSAKLDTEELERKWRDLVDEAFDNFMPGVIYNWLLTKSAIWVEWTWILYVTVR